MPPVSNRKLIPLGVMPTGTVAITFSEATSITETVLLLVLVA